MVSGKAPPPLPQALIILSAREREDLIFLHLNFAVFEIEFRFLWIGILQFEFLLIWIF